MYADTTQATSALRQLAGMMQLTGREVHSNRLHRRAELMEEVHQCVLDENSRSPHSGRSSQRRAGRGKSASPDGQQAMDPAALGNTGQQPHEHPQGESAGHHQRRHAVSPQRSTGLHAISALADMYAARRNYPEALRLQHRILAEEEAAYGRTSQRLVPRLTALALVLDEMGERHDALCVRQRIANMTGLEEV